MKQVYISILLLISFSFSQIVSVSEAYDMVYVKSPAKSKQIICKTRVDLTNGLIDNNACDVDNIHVRDKNNFWVGSLGGISAYGDKYYADYDTERYAGKGRKVIVDYVIPTESASQDNAKYVSCPANYIKKIEDEYFICIKKQLCKKNEKYDIENNECITPDSGYIWLNNDKTDFNQRPACNGKNERYNVETNECEYKLENSHWIGTTVNYECNKGFVFKNDGYTIICEEKANCNNTQKYDNDENKCIDAPLHGSWTSEGMLICDTGYIDVYGTCEEKANCNADERYNQVINTCVKLPNNAQWDNNIDITWSCKYGYIEIAGNCVEKANCNYNQKYEEFGNYCIDAPEHGLWNTMGDLVCNAGYVEIDNSCVKKLNCEHWNSDNNTCYEKPENSHWSYSEGPTWECNAGFHRGIDNCFKCDDETRYSYEVNTCIIKPENSHWTNDDDWECNNGYVQTIYGCEEIRHCGFFERYDSVHNECVGKPFYSHWKHKNSIEWECDDGYYRATVDKCEEATKINAADYVNFIHDITISFGIADGKDLRQNSTLILNIGTYYNMGFKIGSNDLFNIRGQFGAGFLYTGFSYADSQYTYTDNSINSLAFEFGPSIGVEFWKFTFDYIFNHNIREKFETIEFIENTSKYKFGFNANENININVTIIPDLIKNTKRLLNYDEKMFMLGLTYKF